VVPPLFGALVNLMGNYTMAFLLLAALAITGSVSLMVGAPLGTRPEHTREVQQ
jgi:cyanate permease